ncbi:hypothetical protein BAG01nite_09410 [Brevibacillus agri]|uniref:DUF4145 domain-containing protein n=1 Tax=Brevibacillus agri TaxID=51101 RepID=A0A3M8AAI3_9BACL|nr:hypothetical protein [Brevibacillus agri]MDN4095769.1 hypothetical protein [Brevibacillus agri]QAV14077.1 hypothetical protein BA6348_15700 [Brevibacillus agri]RNB48061.1 hypothetical protein EB820_23530 [Brevibacillus agri]GED24839.1 hypothetical protein BAG01nite_09410 [Brevibacillus agri]
MRLSEILSKPPTLEFKQVEGFLKEKKLAMGKQKKIQVGRIALNYFCKNCADVRTFCSGEEIYCIGVNGHLVSIDCVLTCHCGASVQIWFLVDCEEEISGRAPKVRVLKRTEKLSPDALLNTEQYGEFSELLEKAQRAHREGLGAGAIVYLRKIFEKITVQTADAAEISYTKYEGGNPKNFSDLLKRVDERCSIIPREFSANGYKLFRELSNIVHGEYNEELALQKYESLHRLIIGILDNVKNNKELMTAIDSLGWVEVGTND